MVVKTKEYKAKLSGFTKLAVELVENGSMAKFEDKLGLSAKTDYIKIMTDLGSFKLKGQAFLSTMGETTWKPEMEAVLRFQSVLDKFNDLEPDVQAVLGDTLSKFAVQEFRDDVQEKQKKINSVLKDSTKNYLKDKNYLNFSQAIMTKVGKGEIKAQKQTHEKRIDPQASIKKDSDAPLQVPPQHSAANTDNKSVYVEPTSTSKDKMLKSEIARHSQAPKAPAEGNFIINLIKAIFKSIRGSSAPHKQNTSSTSNAPNKPDKVTAVQTTAQIVGNGPPMAKVVSNNTVLDGLQQGNKDRLTATRNVASIKRAVPEAHPVKEIARAVPTGRP